MESRVSDQCSLHKTTPTHKIQYLVKKVLTCEKLLQSISGTLCTATGESHPPECSLKVSSSLITAAERSHIYWTGSVSVGHDWRNNKGNTSASSFHIRAFPVSHVLSEMTGSTGRHHKYFTLFFFL